jgi:hypothetical protein
MAKDPDYRSFLFPRIRLGVAKKDDVIEVRMIALAQEYEK